MPGGDGTGPRGRARGARGRCARWGFARRGGHGMRRRMQGSQLDPEAEFLAASARLKDPVRVLEREMGEPGSRAGESWAAPSQAIVSVNQERCIQCGVCVDVCPADALAMDQSVVVDRERCTGCGQCVAA